MFNIERFKLAREIRRLTKAELSDKINISVQTIVDWEKGNTIPKYENLYEIANVLKFPINFFDSEKFYTFNTEKISFRALTKMNAKEQSFTYSYAKLATDLSYWIESQFNLPKCNITAMENISPEEAAKEVRKQWNIKENCIDDTIFLLEKNGIKVFSLMDKVEHVDAFSFWDENTPYVMLTHQKTAERSRFDAMHELGHLILHKNNIYKNKDAEKEANKFASEILMPEDDVKNFSGIQPTLSNFIQLKKRWKVSLLALIYRFYQLNYITEWTYRTLIINSKKRGYDINEPQSIPFEQSTVINKIFKLLKEDNLSIQDISYSTNIPVSELNKLMFDKYAISLVYGTAQESNKSKAKLTLLD